MGPSGKVKINPPNTKESRVKKGPHFKQKNHLKATNKQLPRGPKPVPLPHRAALCSSLGQHILKNQSIANKVFAAAEINPIDTVLEIGPGTGAMTLGLLDRSHKVIAYEIDTRMIAELKKVITYHGGTALLSKCHIHHQDILKAPRLPHFDVCVANLPYKISSPFLFKLLQSAKNYRCAVLFFQKELGNKIVAAPGEPNYGRLSATVRLLAKTKIVCPIPRNAFHPPPQVDSVVVKICPKKDPPPVDMFEWSGLIRVIFSRKHKTLRASLIKKTIIRRLCETAQLLGNQTTFPLVKVALENVLQETQLQDKRPHKLDVPDFLRLILALNQAKLNFTGFAQGEDKLHDIEMVDSSSSHLEEKSFIPTPPIPCFAPLELSLETLLPSS